MTSLVVRLIQGIHKSLLLNRLHRRQKRLLVVILTTNLAIETVDVSCCYQRTYGDADRGPERICQPQLYAPRVRDLNSEAVAATCARDVLET